MTQKVVAFPIQTLFYSLDWCNSEKQFGIKICMVNHSEHSEVHGGHGQLDCTYIHVYDD